MQPRFDFDAASALSRGARSYQEDAVISDFAHGSDVGVVVLSDGMGGHAAGDIASKIVVSEVYSELLFQRSCVETFEASVKDNLLAAAKAANACLKEHMALHPETRGMGATLVAMVVVRGNLYWISIGDSPLFLFRDCELVQLNEDHSMAPQIDFMVKSGLLTKEAGENHPDRNTLTSVLIGTEVPKVDCPDNPVPIQEGDTLIVASDGLQFLSNGEIEAALRRTCEVRSAQVAHELMKSVNALDDPDLDNVSFSVIRVNDRDTASARCGSKEAKPDIRCVG
ncbi:MAG: protein phosphatase 2C domain-containing protein [Pseudomonadota bacterium]